MTIPPTVTPRIIQVGEGDLRLTSAVAVKHLVMTTSVTMALPALSGETINMKAGIACGTCPQRQA